MIKTSVRFALTSDIPYIVLKCELWASYQIRKSAGCACAGNAGSVFPRHWFQRKLLVSDPGMHHGTCVTHVPWCMSGSLTRGGGENVPGIPGACATRNFAYLARGLWGVFHELYKETLPRYIESALYHAQCFHTGCNTVIKCSDIKVSKVIIF